MKRISFLMLIVMLVSALAVPGSASAQTAATSLWTSSIYYYNPDSDPNGGSLQVSYYDYTSETNKGYSPSIPVKAHGSGEVFIGETNVPGGFKGSAVLSSNLPIVAVYEQAPNNDPNYSRLLYSAFDIDQAGSKIFVPSFANDPKGFKSQVGIQNVGNTGTVNVTLKFYTKDAAGKTKLIDPTVTKQIKVSTSYIFPSGDDSVANLPADSWLVIEADRPDAKLVAAVEEMQVKGRRAYAFEGIANPDTKIYMPSLQCKNGHGSQTTFYAIQNTSDLDTVVTVKAYADSSTKNPLAPLGQKAIPLPAGGKYSLSGCLIPGMSYKSASAVITADQKIAVIGKVTGGDGLATSFTGQTSGNTKVALPYVTWFANQVKGYRSTISVMNVGDQPATNIKATFYRNDQKSFEYDMTSKVVSGKVQAFPLSVNSKRSVDPSLAKALRVDGNYRGGVEITSDQPVLVIIRMERKVSGVSGYTYFGEDYSGIPLVTAP